MTDEQKKWRAASEAQNRLRKLLEESDAKLAAEREAEVVRRISPPNGTGYYAFVGSAPYPLEDGKILGPYATELEAAAALAQEKGARNADA